MIVLSQTSVGQTLSRSPVRTAAAAAATMWQYQSVCALGGGARWFCPGGGSDGAEAAVVVEEV